MKDDWSTHYLSENSPILQKLGASKGTYKIKWDRQARVLRVQDSSSGREWPPIPLSSASDAVSLLVGSKTRDDLNQQDIKFLKQLSDAEYETWTRWKQSNYEVRIKVDSTRFIKDIMIRRAGTNDANDHIHIWTDTVTGEQGTHLTIVRNGHKSRHKIDGNKSFDELIDEFTQ